MELQGTEKLRKMRGDLMDVISLKDVENVVKLFMVQWHNSMHIPQIIELFFLSKW